MALNNPLPNLALIEQLTENEMKNYQNWLGKAFVAGQFGVRDAVFNNMETLTGRTTGRQAPLKLYGYARVDQGSSNGWGESIGWKDTNKSPIMDTVQRAFGAAAGNAVGKLFAGKSNADSGLLATADQLLADLGVSVNKTGASTQKSVEGYSFSSSPKVTFGWYMPRMHKQAIVAIKTLIEMASLKSAGTYDNGYMNYAALASALGAGISGVGSEFFGNIANIGTFATVTSDDPIVAATPLSADASSGVYKSVIENHPNFFSSNAKKSDVVKVLNGKSPSASMSADDRRKATSLLNFVQSTNQFGSGSSQLGGNVNNATSPLDLSQFVQGDFTTDAGAAKAVRLSKASYEQKQAPQEPSSVNTDGIIGEILDGSFNVAANAFGVDITLNPLPVRLKFGDLYSLEPLVIKSYAIQMSQELFYTDVSYSGTRQVEAIPIHVMVTVDFDWWMYPSPMRNLNRIMNVPIMNYSAPGSDTFTPTTLPWLKQNNYFE